MKASQKRICNQVLASNLRSVAFKALWFAAHFFTFLCYFLAWASKALLSPTVERSEIRPPGELQGVLHSGEVFTSCKRLWWGEVA